MKDKRFDELLENVRKRRQRKMALDWQGFAKVESDGESQIVKETTTLEYEEACERSRDAEFAIKYHVSGKATDVRHEHNRKAKDYAKDLATQPQYLVRNNIKKTAENIQPHVLPKRKDGTPWPVKTICVWIRDVVRSPSAQTK